jgi:hypothetical protein
VGFDHAVSEYSQTILLGEMTDTQMLIIALPSVLSVVMVLVGILINNSRLGDMNARISELRSHMDNRFDDMRDMWRSELHRIQEVID